MIPKEGDMDLSNPETWKHLWEALMTASYLMPPLLVLAASVGYWFGNKIASANVAGLNGTIDGLKAKVEVLEARLDLAADRYKDVERARAELEKRVQELKAQIAALAPINEKLAATTAKVDMAITRFSTANNALAVALTAANLTTESPALGRPPLTPRSN